MNTDWTNHSKFSLINRVLHAKNWWKMTRHCRRPGRFCYPFLYPNLSDNWSVNYSVWSIFNIDCVFQKFFWFCPKCMHKRESNQASSNIGTSWKSWNQFFMFHHHDKACIVMSVSVVCNQANCVMFVHVEKYPWFRFKFIRENIFGMLNFHI